jgi:hypothetical protein
MGSKKDVEYLIMFSGGTVTSRVQVPKGDTPSSLKECIKKAKWAAADLGRKYWWAGIFEIGTEDNGDDKLVWEGSFEFPIQMKEKVHD